MRRDTGRRSWVSLLFPALLLLTACAQPTSTAGEAIRIGVIVPQTSGMPGAARAVVEGAELAVAEINADRGIHGRRLALVTADDHGIPEDAARLVGELAAQGVVGIVGPLTDATAIAAAPAAERRRVVLITPGATAPLPYGGHYVFRTALPARTQAQALAAYLVEQLRVRRVAVVHDSNDYGTMVALAFDEAARAKGATITGRRLFRDGEKDFARHVQGAINDRAQAVFLAAYPDEGVLFLRQARAVTSGLLIAGSDALYTEDTATWAGAAANDLYVPAGFVPETPLPIVRAFVASYHERHGRIPDQFAAQAYDAVRVLAFALRRAGPDREKVRDVVGTLRRFPAVTGELSFDRWGDPVRDVIITRISGGRFITVGH